MARRFHLWFGGIFLAIGALSLLVAALLALALALWPGVPPEAWVATVAPIGVGLAFTVIGGIFATIGLRRRRIEHHLRAVGTTTRATVVAVEPTAARINRRRLWRVRYTYDDLAGGTHGGDSGHLSAEEAHGYRVGEQVVVRYDPARPDVNAWVGREDDAGASV